MGIELDWIVEFETIWELRDAYLFWNIHSIPHFNPTYKDESLQMIQSFQHININMPLYHFQLYQQT